MEDLYNFIPNGFLIVQHVNNSNYTGVGGITWPLYKDLERTLGIPYGIRNSVAVATDWHATKIYLQKCREQRLNVRLLLIESQVSNPQVHIQRGEWKFLGYDMSYVEGDFYSAIQQEILRKDVNIFQEWEKKINSFGLFENYQDAVDFKRARERMNSSKVEGFGDFYVVRVSRQEQILK